MRSARKIGMQAGIAGGLLFVVHGSFPYVYSWPLIWPPLAGATACWLATREPGPDRLRAGLMAALTTAALAGLIVFVGWSVVMYVVLHTDIVPAARQSGAPGALTTAASIAAAASLGAISAVIAFLAGVLVLPVRYL